MLSQETDNTNSSPRPDDGTQNSAPSEEVVPSNMDVTELEADEEHGRAVDFATTTELSVSVLDEVVNEAAQEASVRAVENNYDVESLGKIMEKLKFATADSTNAHYKNIIAECVAFNTDFVGQEWKIDQPGPHLLDGALRYTFVKCEKSNEFLESPNGRIFRGRGLGMSTATGIRSALSSYWGHHFNVRRTEYNPQTHTGNPALAYKYSLYIASLRKRKAKDGERSESVRALTPSDLRLLHHHCYHNTKNPVMGRMLYCVYLISYLCLLRIDEALKIDMLHIECIQNEPWKITLTLDFRKTEQTGGCKPFVLLANNEEDEKYLCPIRALWSWIGLAKRVEGPLFLHVDDYGRIASKEAPQRLSYSTFKSQFEKQLKAMGYRKWWLYGTHSFRRGGCQYYHAYLEPKEDRWSFKKLADWGGWSENFDSNSMYRYICGANDLETVPRDLYQVKGRKRKAQALLV